MNPIRAGIAETRETSPFTSAYERIQARTETSAAPAEVPAAGEAGTPRDSWLSPIELQADVTPAPRTPDLGDWDPFTVSGECFPLSQ
jgi:hypothetical protein